MISIILDNQAEKEISPFARIRHNNVKLRSLSAQHSKFGPAKHGDSGFGEKPEVDQI